MMTKSSVNHSENQLGEKKYDYSFFFNNPIVFHFGTFRVKDISPSISAGG